MMQLAEALRYKPEGRGFDFPIMSLEFFFDMILPGIDSASNRHEY
jgi:hypothetical protein